ncbi:serpin family protein [Clostridiaceae bacterium M8S5]|nr:serpin family protein [Clostridiaceae bacterium M8S5]
MKKFCTIFIIIIVISFVGCTNNKMTSSRLIEIKDKSLNNGVVADINSLGVKTFKATSDGKTNNIVSPISLAMVLSSINQGAKDNTKKELDTVINSAGLSNMELAEQYAIIINALVKTTKNTDTIINLANSLWVDKDKNIKSDFQQLIGRYYDTDTFSIEFSNKDAKKSINNWISEKTDGLIKKYIENIDDLKVLYVINTLYFKGDWVDKFDKRYTKKEKFTLKSKEIVEVKMMNEERKIDCYEDDKIVSGELKYKDCSMNIIVPKGDIDDYIKNFNLECIKEMEYRNCEIKLPRFEYKVENDLTKCLKDIGIRDLFSSNEADLSGILEVNTPLWTDIIRQKCVIQVDEEGTKAAAVTSAEVNESEAPEENIIKLHVNKPFIYVIKHNETGVVLFMGVVYDPNKN